MVSLLLWRFRLARIRVRHRRTEVFASWHPGPLSAFRLKAAENALYRHHLNRP